MQTLHNETACVMNELKEKFRLLLVNRAMIEKHFVHDWALDWPILTKKPGKKDESQTKNPIAVCWEIELERCTR